MKRVFIIMVAACIITLSGCGSEEKMNEQVQNDTEVQNDSESIEPNTSEMVDSIISKANEDADTATLEQRQEALDFVKNNIDDCTKDDETMENMIYYGSLLEYAYNNDENPDIKNVIISGVGVDAVQAAKYIYRGYTDEEEQAACKENIEQVNEGLEKIDKLREAGMLVE